MVGLLAQLLEHGVARREVSSVALLGPLGPIPSGRHERCACTCDAARRRAATKNSKIASKTTDVRIACESRERARRNPPRHFRARLIYLEAC